MALRGQVFLMGLIMLYTLVSTTHGRKLLMNVEQTNVPSRDDSLYLTALSEGYVLSSTPSRTGHAATIDQKLVARHLAAVDRILRSVPSPGVGH